MLRSHYELLEVAPDADAAVIKRAYLKLARTLHPDMPHGSSALFGLVTEAYEVLKDPRRRASYDLSLTRGTDPPPTTSPPETGSPRPEAPPSPPPSPPRPPPRPPPSASPHTAGESPRHEPAEATADHALRRTSAARTTLPLLIVSQLVQRLPRWVKTRRGFACLGLATLLAALVAGHGGDPSTVLVSFLAGLVVFAVFLWFVAKSWESRTWPATAPFARVRRHSAQSHQLRADVNGQLLQDRGGFLFERRYFFTATGLPPVRLGAELFFDVQKQAETAPAKIATDGARTWWQFKNGFW